MNASSKRLPQIAHIAFLARCALVIAFQLSVSSSSLAQSNIVPDETGISPRNAPEGEVRGPQPPTQNEPGEVLVLDPPEGLEPRLAALGFHVIESVKMEGLGIRMLRVSTPPNTSVFQAIERLSREFPDVTFDANTYFNASAGPI
ncbi:hypothetical protein [Magnetovibrio sp.]|uniref:hypothetical protein n=1 Tax=Magnetovibrio sp. TaxID=2024836 RepID=UPI002F92A1DA